MKRFLPIMPVRQYSATNRKRSRRGWYWLGVAVIVLLVAITSCAPKAYPIAEAVPRPRETVEVSPGAQKVRTQIATIRESGNAVSAGLSRAVNEADRLRKQKVATEKELENLWAQLTQEKEHFAKMLFDLAESQRTAEQLVLDAAARDEEIRQLRKHHDLMTKRLDDAAKYQAMAAPKVAVYDWFANKVYWFAGITALGLLVYFLLPLILKTLKPL